MMAHRVLLVLLAITSPASAQRRWLDPIGGHGIGMAFTLGTFDDNITDSPASTYALRGRYRVPGSVTLTAEVPLARAKLLSGLSGTAVGNPWLGLEYAPSRGVQLEFGVRMNLWTPDTQPQSLAYAYGQWLDFDRREAWFVRTWALRAMAHVGRMPQRGGFVTGRIGAAGLAVSGSGADGELLVHYGARAGFAAPRWAGWLGIGGQGLATENTGSVADRTTHQVEATLATRGAPWDVEFTIRRFVSESFGSSIPLTAQFTVVVPI
jgi:hypothetical protein